MASTSLSRRRWAIPARVSRSTIQFIFSLLVISSAITNVEAVLDTCYDPSGDVRPDQPCFPNAPSSACCGTGWVCTNTSICIAGPTVKLNPGDGTYFEGSCSDQTWNSQGCPSFCRSAELAKNAANGVYNCGNGYYCCSAPEFKNSATCCQNSTVQFFLGDYTNMTTIGGAIGPGESTTSASSTSTSSTSSPAKASATTTTSTSSTSNPASNNNGNGGLSTGAKAGIAIAVILGVAALAGIGFLLLRQQKNTRLLKEQFESMQNQNPNTQYTKVQDSIPHSGGNPAKFFTPPEPKPYELLDGRPAIPLAELPEGRR